MRNKALTGTALVAALAGLWQLEGVEYKAYRDIAGVPTICAGTTRNVKMTDTATVEQCWSMSLEDYRYHESEVLRSIKVPLSTETQTALTFFCLNVGNAGCRGSTAFRLINQGKLPEGCDALRMWNKVTINGKKVVSKGLVNRREAEVQLCKQQSASWWSSAQSRFSGLLARFM